MEIGRAVKTVLRAVVHAVAPVPGVEEKELAGLGGQGRDFPCTEQEDAEDFQYPLAVAIDNLEETPMGKETSPLGHIISE
ncbi:hypothetical protein NDU88_000917 [Pleurodeles waltl]|uniref:Uncharacterized protein n=1 Tax=Pleurodeles waltl TaxID=8319 RepID=A0AAV7SAV8_PLEWA|nr:hypothetical protein NDU88_000917 [Pleurodeles waltl]